MFICISAIVHIVMHIYMDFALVSMFKGRLDDSTKCRSYGNEYFWCVSHAVATKFMALESLLFGIFINTKH